MTLDQQMQQQQGGDLARRGKWGRAGEAYWGQGHQEGRAILQGQEREMVLQGQEREMVLQGQGRQEVGA